MEFISVHQRLSAANILWRRAEYKAMTHNTGFLNLVNDAKSRVQQIDIEGYKKMRESGRPHILVDTREESEWTAGHVAGAVHMSKGIIERDIETKVPDKHATLVLYCGGGFRSALVADNLQKMGYTQAISLDGGWRALKESGLPLEK
jgi:rhodanese-related sulfurtransferase